MSKRKHALSHEERARNCLASVQPGMSVVDANASLAAAQVHATLALVEQQRIANLISVGHALILSDDAKLAASKRIYKGLDL